MNLERLLIVSIAVAGVAGLVALTTDVGANATRQGDGTLAQEPMHLGATVSPNFIMAIDDSGSMTFQTMFPGADGEGCWSTTDKSFFSGTALRTSGSCDYLYVLPGARINNYYGIPPFDKYGFARSPDYNPTYYSPDTTYEPWVKSDLTSYGNASLTDTRLDPRQAATVNLFASYFGKNTNDDFRIQTGMVIPSGTKYARVQAVCVEWNRKGECTKTQNQYVEYTASSDLTWSANAEDIAIEHTPAVFYLKQNRTIDGYSTAVEVTNACGTNCSLYKYTPTSDEAKQNFANWFSYYGNRNRAMVAGLTRSLKDTEKLRVGYFTINSGLKDGAYNNYPALTMRDMDVTADKSALLTSVLQLSANGSTPNRFAVEHIGKQFNTNTSIIQNACQKNAGMLFTDGYSNQGGPTGYGNADGTLGVPFADSYDDTLADIAAYYYNTTLRGNAFTAGKVPTANPQICESGTAAQKKALDCNTNLHMNFYGITLGARGKQFGVNWGVRTDGRTDGALATQQAMASATSPTWETRTNDNPNTVDEIWHATMNARGGYINAQTPADITNAMRSVLASVGVGGGVSGSLAITGTRLGDNSLSVTPRFNRNGVDWYGDIVAAKPVQRRGADNKTTITYTTSWTASAKLPAAADRKLFYATTTDDSTPAVADFVAAGPSTLADLCANYASGTCSPMAGADVNALGVTAAEATAYLAGNRTLEGTKLRTRTHPLGDIINSTPVVTAPTDDYGYALLRKADGTFAYDPYDYNGYMEAKKNRKRMVYVGANDGMLHAFRGDTGVESFGYIPATAVGYMGNLLFPASPSFQHRYYVDGPVVASDALFGTTWKSVLVGTSGAGGRSVFGLDVSSAGSGGFTAEDVLWEVNDKIPGAVGDRIGYVLAKPVIVPVRSSTGRPVWKAIFGAGAGNKLNSVAATQGTVTLFVVDMATGAVDYIDAKEDNGPVAPNGLGNIVAIDRYQYDSTTHRYALGSDGMVDTVYGGDLQGNVWKFDLLATGSNRVALGGKPLFTAKDGTGDTAKRQPITGGLEAAVGARNGVMVLFGTGSFSRDGDKSNNDTQTMYGVLDMPGESVTLPLTRSNLVAQTMSNSGVISSNSVDYFTKRGWYLDLGVTGSSGFVKGGERMVGYPRIDDAGTIYFTTYAPTSGDACSGGGSNYFYGLKVNSGQGALGVVMIGSLDGDSPAENTGRLGPLAGDGSAPVTEVGINTTGKQAGLEGNPTDADLAADAGLPDQICTTILSVSGAPLMYRARPCGRQSWRQIR
ncbi:pilus assembly protein [Lysobacter soli]|uniref:pilus assembly protein n=1 Tax=Lysobacter soli TaxID=453783 RepID=UPI0036C35E00